jgi:hypothetical protein
MLDGIGSAANIGKFLARVKDKSDGVRLMGFGHRVYKNVDPRAKIIRSMCYRVLEKMGKVNSPLFELALKLEEIALQDYYFVSRRLYPNVDFYSGIIYSALGIPRSMFTVMFRDRAHCRLGCTLAGNGLQPAHENRPAAPPHTGPQKEITRRLKNAWRESSEHHLVAFTYTTFRPRTLGLIFIYRQ